MRLLFIIPDISTAGGVQKIVAQLSAYLQDATYQVTILNCLPFNGVSFYQLHPQVVIQSLNRPVYPTSRFSKLKWYYQLIKPLTAFLADQRFDIVFAEGGYISASLSLTKVKNTVKVGCEHVSHDAVNLLHGLIRKYLYKKLAAVVVLSKADQQFFRKFLPTVYYIPNFITQVTETTINSESKIIMAVGRLTNQKGFDLLIDAFKIVNKTYPDWKLIIHGEGEKRNDLIVQLEKANLNKVVFLPGETNEVSKSLKSAAIFVLSSRFEGFPLVLLEAMSLGICCISFNIKGVNEVIRDNENGSLVVPENVSLMAEKICSLIESSTLRKNLGIKAKETAINYQLVEVGGQWVNLIKQLKRMRVDAV